MNKYLFQPKKEFHAFTVVELIIVAVIIAIAAILAVPMISSASDTQVKAAAAMIAADLEYAKNMAVTHQRDYYVIFDTSADSYEVHNSDGVIDHPLKSGSSFIVSFPSDSRLNQVSISSADFDGDASKTITFDYLGSPYHGQGTINPLNNGEVIVECNGFSLTVNVEPITGYVTIQ